MTQQQAGIAPINPFPKPDFVSFGGAVHLGSVPPVIFAIVFGIWVLYSLVVTYHWIRYGHRSFLALPLLVIHVMISSTLLLIAAGGTH